MAFIGTDNWKVTVLDNYSHKFYSKSRSSNKWFYNEFLYFPQFLKNWRQGATSITKSAIKTAVSFFNIPCCCGCPLLYKQTRQWCLYIQPMKYNQVSHHFKGRRKSNPKPFVLLILENMLNRLALTQCTVSNLQYSQSSLQYFEENTFLKS